MKVSDLGKVLFVVGLVSFSMGENIVAASIIFIAALMVGMPLIVKSKENEKKEYERPQHRDDD